mgnify:CR=1 FL=1
MREFEGSKKSLHQNLEMTPAATIIDWFCDCFNSYVYYVAFCVQMGVKKTTNAPNNRDTSAISIIPGYFWHGRIFNNDTCSWRL